MQPYELAIPFSVKLNISYDHSLPLSGVIERINIYVEYDTYRNQSTATMRAMSSAGRPTACKTSIIVTKPADGIPAAPMDATVAVKLKENKVLN